MFDIDGLRELGSHLRDLDKLLTLVECAQWLGMGKREVALRSRGKRATIPAVWINDRVVRFHPRTILAKFAAQSGVSLNVIAASFGVRSEPRPHETIDLS